MMGRMEEEMVTFRNNKSTAGLEESSFTCWKSRRKPKEERTRLAT